MKDGKIKNITQIKKIISRLQAKGKKIVFTNGCFDILHYGHVKYLQDAKKLGDFLVIGVNSDASIKRLKGKDRPIVQEKDRLRTLAALGCVDFLVKFSQDTPRELIKRLQPDILVKGADWKGKTIVGSDIVKNYGGKVKTIKFIPGRSTTKLIRKIAAKFPR
jgi:D-beta-D-heptose 7-phosphate kinase/D-beta-D-heptose 1-phosphate adenosyltransferase